MRTYIQRYIYTNHTYKYTKKYTNIHTYLDLYTNIHIQLYIQYCNCIYSSYTNQLYISSIYNIEFDDFILNQDKRTAGSSRGTAHNRENLILLYSMTWNFKCICRALWGAFTREAWPERSTVSCASAHGFQRLEEPSEKIFWVSVGFPTSAARFRGEIVRRHFLSPCTMPNT